MSDLPRRSAWDGVDEDEVADEEASENEVKMERGGFDAGKENGQGDRGEENSREEGFAVAVMKVVTGFEVFAGYGVHQTGVHQAICGVEHPDGNGHGEDGRGWEMNVVGARDEPGPERGDGGCVEGEQMPEGDRRIGSLRFSGVVMLMLRMLDWGCGGHKFILGLRGGSVPQGLKPHFCLEQKAQG